MHVAISLTIIRGPTPYAIKMDSSQIGCQNLQFVKGLKQKCTHEIPINFTLDQSSLNPTKCYFMPVWYHKQQVFAP